MTKLLICIGLIVSAGACTRNKGDIALNTVRYEPAPVPARNAEYREPPNPFVEMVTGLAAMVALNSHTP